MFHNRAVGETANLEFTTAQNQSGIGLASYILYFVSLTHTHRHVITNANCAPLEATVPGLRITHES